MHTRLIDAMHSVLSNRVVSHRCTHLVVLVSLMVGKLSCSTPSDGESMHEGDAVFPINWEQSLVELRDCRRSIDHELEFVRLFASKDAAAPYEECVTRGECDEPFASGSIFLKPQYRDAECRELVRYSAVKREQPAKAPGPAGWRWQEVLASGKVVADGAPSECVGCHAQCDGSYDLRCAMDL
ncbi:MAG: hypothetical protein RJA70_1114 [Pseudomonadota bacterium]|jgi:hypothetical protein